MRVKAIVEGHGEVDAVPELIRRLGYAGAVFTIQALSAIRAHRTDFTDPAKLQKLVSLARLDSPDAILIIFDADDECPVEALMQIEHLAKLSAHPIPVEIVIANREYEAWFLGALESLRGVRGISEDAAFTGEPEGPRDAKGQVSQQMIGNRRYSETADQTALTASFDLASAYQRCRSFRRAVSAMGRLFRGAGQLVPSWPPPEWTRN